MPAARSDRNHERALVLPAMKLARLRLTGFKSFAGGVELPFEDGLTAIVGPNGCGKSNISDAVRWVLGEQRARLLRGQRMEEIIFHGSARHRPVNVAEVSLVFDNADGALPVSYAEVEITRRLSRSGMSEYLLNQTPVRLRDIQDLLRGTGLGSDAGVVIEAQMIDRLLSDRTEERRSLFEEAAGIGLYRDRKESTERQLQRTTEDLQRLDDVVGEVQREVRSLARQRGRAERHTKVTAERFAIVMTLTRHELARFDAAARELAATREHVATELPSVRDALAAREQARESAVQTRQAAEGRRTDLERRLATARLDVERIEGDIRVAAERIESASRRREHARAERLQASERGERLEREREAARAARAAASEARASVQGELDLRTQSEEEARARLAAVRLEVRALEEEAQAAAERLRGLAGERASAERDVSDLREQLEQAEGARTARRAEREAADRRRREAETAATQRSEDVRAGETALERARHALVAAREREEVLRAERRAADDGLAALTAREDALERLERDREGLAPAARRLLAARDALPAGAVLGPLSDFLHASQREAGLVERLFGDWLHAVLVRADAIGSIQAWHATESPGPLVLLPDSGPAGPVPGDELPVSADGPAAAWARALLGGHEILDAAGRAIRRPNGAVALAGDSAGGGLLARRAELEAIRGDVARRRRDVERLTGEQAAAADAHAAAAAAQDTAVRQLETTRAAAREAQNAADDARRVSQRLERETAELDATATRLGERVAQRAEQLGVMTREAAEVERAHAQRGENLTARRAVLHELEAQQEAARERRVHWQVEEAQVAAREAAAGEREARATAELAEIRAELARLEAELGDADQDGAGVAEQRQQWTDALAERRVTVQELDAAARAAEAEVAAADAALAAAEREVAGARDALTTASERGHRAEVEHAELAGRRQALIERAEAEWRRPLAELLAATEDVEGDADLLRQEAERLAEQLEGMGPVNPLAVQEHAEELKRLEFLTTQRADLVEARDTLQAALAEIDTTARAMFLETFAAIRRNFQTVFLTLFDGGECDVRLADENDPLGSEIEIAASPRGKRTQRINLLSSGERALVAISLLFSIYLAKPSPFCLLDEVDAPLDDANVVRFIRLLNEFKDETQFIVITHNPRTMQVADAVYGVTMQEPGVSTIVGVRLGEAAERF
jgi:chromosome segregation protein